MGRMTRIALIALALAAILGGGVAGTEGVAAANGYEQWTGPYNDGCFYHWDGYAYTSVACPRTDGGFDFYAASAGRWAYHFSAWFMNDGSTWLYTQGQYYIVNAPATDMFGGSITVGGGFGGGLTNNALVNEILMDMNNGIINAALSPNCYEIVNGVCYYW